LQTPPVATRGKPSFCDSSWFHVRFVRCLYHMFT
jgi:hypothetical protein